MSKILSKKIKFDDALIASEGVTSFNVYYQKDGVATIDSPKITIPVVEGQSTYEIDCPSQLPLAEGQYGIGVSALDAAGNESDISVISSFFDFTAPTAPSGLKVE